jgi:hypothetical protein
VVCDRVYLRAMRWLHDNWPSWSHQWDLPFGSLTDLIGIGLGFVVLCFTVYVAIRQLQIMKQQTAMMEEQAKASKRQEAIAEKQGEIAEKQHLIMKEQLAKRPNPYVYLSGRGPKTQEGLPSFSLYICNRGSRTLRDYHWNLYFPRADRDSVSLIAQDGEMSEVPVFLPPPGGVENEKDLEKYLYLKMTGFSSLPLHPAQSLPLASLIARTDRSMLTARVLWSINSEDGEFPETGGQATVSNLPEF